MEDQSAPIPEERKSKLGGGISRDVLDGGFGTSKRHQPSEPLAPHRSPSSYAALLGMTVRVSIGFYGGGMTARLSDLGLMYDGKICTRFLLLGLAICRSKLTESTIGSSLSALLEHALGDLNRKD